MTKNEIDEFIVGLCETAKGILEEKGEIMPVAMVITDDGHIIPCMLPFKNDDSEEKYAMYGAVGVTMKKFNANKVVLVNDVALKYYSSKEEADKAKENYQTESPLMYPESLRQDGILLQEVDLGDDTVNSYFMRYENTSPRKYHELARLNKEGESMAGAIISSLKDGYARSEEILESLIEADPLGANLFQEGMSGIEFMGLNGKLQLPPDLQLPPELLPPEPPSELN